jgi:cytochrome c-type biogenesis protein CcmH
LPSNSWQAPGVTRIPLVVAAFAALLIAVSASPLARADDTHTAPVASAGANDDLRKFVPGAKALEGKILAPCCWNQTVDIHGSEVANAIRREIRTRLLAGESSDAITASFVERYGQKILAMPADTQLPNIALTALVVIGAVGVAGVFMLKRWRAVGSVRKAPKVREEGVNERLDARLDAELKALDD